MTSHFKPHFETLSVISIDKTADWLNLFPKLYETAISFTLSYEYRMWCD